MVYQRVQLSVIRENSPDLLRHFFYFTLSFRMCQQRVKSDPLTATTNGLILIHLVYSGLASAITPAFRFCFSR